MSTPPALFEELRTLATEQRNPASMSKLNRISSHPLQGEARIEHLAIIHIIRLAENHASTFAAYAIKHPRRG